MIDVRPWMSQHICEVPSPGSPFTPWKPARWKKKLLILICRTYPKNTPQGIVMHQYADGFEKDLKKKAKIIK